MLDIKSPFKSPFKSPVTSRRSPLRRLFGSSVQHDSSRKGVRPTVHQPNVKLIPIDMLKRGDIVLFGPDGTPGALLIQVATASHYHHVALYDGHNNVIQAMPEGVCCSSLTHPHLIGLRPEVAWWRRRVALWWARTKLGDPYDTRSLFLIELDRFIPGLRLDTPTADRFSCAVFVAEAYRAAGVDLFPGHRWQDLVPKDFALLLPHQHRPHT